MAITTNTEYKTWAGITSSTNDSLITTLISQVSRIAERVCNRTRTLSGATSFESATYTEVFDGQAKESVRLRNTPITSITSVTLLAGDGSTLRTVASTEYKFDPASGELHLTPSVIGRFGYGTMPTSFGFGTGWNSEYREVNGVSPAFGDQFRNVSVVYVGGYATAPDDLKAAVWRGVDMMMKLRGNDFTLKGESIGNRSATYAGGEYNRVVDKEIRSIFSQYWNPVL